MSQTVTPGPEGLLPLPAALLCDHPANPPPPPFFFCIEKNSPPFRAYKLISHMNFLSQWLHSPSSSPLEKVEDHFLMKLSSGRGENIKVLFPNKILVQFPAPFNLLCATVFKHEA